MAYQYDITCDNAEFEGRPAPAWSVQGTNLVMDDVDALDDAMYRLGLVRDIESPGLARSAVNLLNRLTPVFKQATAKN